VASLRLASERLRAVSEQLNALSPLAVLDRGYAIAQREADGRVLRSKADVSPRDAVRVRLAEGSFIARVERLED
jgi:exodeoxyribonuclease VII large subunit